MLSEGQADKAWKLSSILFRISGALDREAFSNTNQLNKHVLTQLNLLDNSGTFV